MKRKEIYKLHRKFVNPYYIDLLEALDHGRNFLQAIGTKLYDDTGKEYTDFLSGFGVHNIGHNHPELINILHKALDAKNPSFLNIDAPKEAAELARKLNRITHPDLCRIAYGNSGAEVVEIAIKTAKAATQRETIIACHGGYHGLTTGALSLMSDSMHRDPFGKLLDNINFINFGNMNELKIVCEKMKPAAFIVEPIQAEGGVLIPEPSYLKNAAKICKSNGVMLIIDEIQTGLGRTGNMFATPFKHVVPDVLLIGKALSGGLVPISAALISKKTFKSAFSGPKRCHLNASTFAGGHLALSAALETLHIIQSEKLYEKAEQKGLYLKQGLEGLLSKHNIIKEIRAKGLLAGIEFKQATGLLMKTIPAYFRDSLCSYAISAHLLHKYRIITQPCSLKGNVLRIEPPLTISEKDIDLFISALDKSLLAIPSHEKALSYSFKKRVFKNIDK